MLETNRLFNDILESRSGNYCHCLELDSVYTYEFVIEAFISEYQDKYTEEEYIDFFETMSIYYYVEDGIENIEDEEALYNFNVREYIEGTLWVKPWKKC